MEKGAARTLWLLTIGVLAWAAAIYLLELHIRTGPSQQSINIRWDPEALELERLAAERTLKLGNGEQLDRDRWAYHLADHSRETIRRIITHPLVADTGHIDRDRFRVLIDAPSIPSPLRRALAADMGPPLSAIFAAVGLVAFWRTRRPLADGLARVRAVSGLDLAFALLLLAAGFAFFSDNGQGVDENIHYDQIARLTRGDWSLHPSLTTIPGFHALVAAILWSAGGVSEFSVRLVVFLLSVVTVLVFYALARTVQGQHAGSRTLQFALLPILFTQFFLIYTDVTAVLFVLLMMLAAARRRYWLAGMLGFVACLMRQNNVIWVAFVMLWSYIRESGWAWRPLGESLARYWTFIATGAACLVFVAANHGQAALGEDVGSHPLGSLYFTNVFFMLFLSCFLFLPLWWGYRRGTLASLRGWKPWLFLLLTFPVFWLGFINDHPHNNERASYFLPNALLIYFSSTVVTKLLFFLPVAVAILSAAAVPMKKPWRLLLPFSIVFLLPEWLVVPRYYLVPMSLFLVAREETTAGAERMQTILFLTGSTVVFLVVERAWGWV